MQHQPRIIICTSRTRARKKNAYGLYEPCVWVCIKYKCLFIRAQFLLLVFSNATYPHFLHTHTHCICSNAAHTAATWLFFIIIGESFQVNNVYGYEALQRPKKLKRGNFAPALGNNSRCTAKQRLRGRALTLQRRVCTTCLPVRMQFSYFGECQTYLCWQQYECDFIISFNVALCAAYILSISRTNRNDCCTQTYARTHGNSLDPRSDTCGTFRTKYGLFPNHWLNVTILDQHKNDMRSAARHGLCRKYHIFRLCLDKSGQPAVSERPLSIFYMLDAADIEHSR